MSLIEPLIHRCTVRSGNLAGNKTAIEVTAWAVEIERLCEHCGEPLATKDALLFHIYEELTNG